MNKLNTILRFIMSGRFFRQCRMVEDLFTIMYFDDMRTFVFVDWDQMKQADDSLGYFNVTFKMLEKTKMVGTVPVMTDCSWLQQYHATCETNVSKTKIMTIGSDGNEEPVIVSGDEVERVTQFNLLGSLIIPRSDDPEQGCKALQWSTWPWSVFGLSIWFEVYQAFSFPLHILS